MRFERVVILILLLAFAVVSVFTATGLLAGFDADVYNFFAGLQTPGLTKIMRAITEIGSVSGVSAAIFIVVFLAVALPKTKRFIFLLSAAMILSVLLNMALKEIFKIPRPDVFRLTETVGYGYPSGHSMNSATVYALIFIFMRGQIDNKYVRRAVCSVLAITPVLIGVSRVYLGAHNFTDVLGGWTMGLTLALASQACRLNR